MIMMTLENVSVSLILGQISKQRKCCLILHSTVGPLSASVKRKSKYTHVQHNDKIQYKEEFSLSHHSVGFEPEWSTYNRGILRSKAGCDELVLYGIRELAEQHYNPLDQ